MSALPRISCIMPTITGTRRAFVSQAIALFEAQTYPNKELIILDSGRNQHPVYVHDCERHYLTYVYVASDRYVTIGAKRNLAASLATGDMVCHWDDDDYYAPDRLDKQIAPLLDGKADVTALQMRALYDVPTRTLYECSDEIHERLFTRNVRSGTLMYPISFLRHGLCYPNSSTGEDVALLRSLLDCGALLARVTDPCYVCIRHRANISDGLDYTWDGLTPVPLDTHIPVDHHAFYQQLASKNET